MANLDGSMEEKYLQELRAILETGWSRKTAHPDYRDEWDPEHKSYGQCYTTARVLNYIFGWETVHMKHHIWNILPDGREVDFTSDQYGENGNGIDKVKWLIGEPIRFKPIQECNGVEPILKNFFDVVEKPLWEFKEKYSDVLAEK